MSESLFYIYLDFVSMDAMFPSHLFCFPLGYSIFFPPFQVLCARSVAEVMIFVPRFMFRHMAAVAISFRLCRAEGSWSVSYI